MGLLQDNKSRNKISNDPNNTKWMRDTTTFGQKILRAQGWEPGQFLGAQDAPHAALHSAASASYIRVVLKDDMKGLGFDRAKANEVTGLDVFSDVLSRLNGKSDAAVQEDKDARLAVKTHRYVEMRWGPMRFVRGGLLVGDKLQEAEESAESESAGDRGVEEAKAKKEKKSKKRKAEAEAEDADTEVTEETEKKRRRKDGEGDKADKKKRSKDEKKEKKKSSKPKVESDDSDDTGSDEKAARKKARKERKAMKKERREKKEEKRRRKVAKAAAAGSPDSSDSDSDSGATASATPATTSGTSTPLGNRNFSRSRIIAQKRRAIMDTKALAQIFMIKA
ncbi:G-patch RNA maturation protein [Cordyceps militaris CM01]|uniref:PinX1-related protein 1 n=1 Tax=Cordyceps militaris (strain CM01) TaxID=983644 RepID=G3JJ97_CORMM|nr:G-patch RNA maturation protein [Cordyceps militaris CM01]EGX92039.1 G-patch RNA maturation protein [Cordyceps militaris CM01]